ncbi:MAG TPA: hypothetical protein VHL50_01580 [Pyrinomonadaceae bacterium]|nr:hypothetical protein [Pyrinomonadaceae bacterium]
MVCLFSGFLTFAGSVLGHSLGQTGLFVGAVVGGFAGVVLAVWVSARAEFLPKADRLPALVGGIAGYIVAAVVAVNNLWTPIIPLASVALIGGGALVGRAIAHRRAERNR